MTTCKRRTEGGALSHAFGQHPEQAEPIGASALDTAHREPIRILRLAQVIRMTGLGKTKIYELQSEGDFPMRVQLTEHSVGWVEEEVQTWLAGRIAARASPAPRANTEPIRQPSR